MLKRISKYIQLICFSFILFACATTQKYGTALNTWINQSESHLIEKWGPPASVHEYGGIKYLTYHHSSSGYVHMPDTKPSGKKPIIDLSTYIAPDGSRAVYLYTSSCTTTFAVRDGKVKSWNHKGNTCKST